MTKTLAVIATLFLLGGCASDPSAATGSAPKMLLEGRAKWSGEKGFQWRGSMLEGATNLNSPAGTFVTARCPSELQGGRLVTCTAVAVNAEPPGLEAYSYVYKIKIRAGGGWTYGEDAIRAFVVGDHAECQKLSEAHNQRLDGRANEGDLRLSSDPAERCVGPFYIR